MEAKLPLRVGIVILLGIAVTFASNHVSARIAFDHGVSVATAAGVRASATALFLLAFLRLQGVSFRLPPGVLGRACLMGLLVATQSFCLYSAVARIPAALALLVFNLCPMLYVLLSWLTGKEAPRASALLPMPVALLGLALALDLRPEQFAARWAELGTGVIFAFTGGLAFAVVLYSNAYWLKAVDGRLRTFVLTGVAAIVICTGATVTHSWALPTDTTGWSALAALTVLYGSATTALFMVLPRLAATSSTVALNFEPIALLGLGWLFLGQAVTWVQVLGAFLVVGAIAWISLGGKR